MISQNRNFLHGKCCEADGYYFCVISISNCRMLLCCEKEGIVTFRNVEYIRRDCGYGNLLRKELHGMRTERIAELPRMYGRPRQ